MGSIGSTKCNSPLFLTCNNVKECETFAGRVTKETFKLIHHFNCNSKCLICLFFVRCMGSNMLDLLLLSLGSDGTIMGEDHMQKKGKIICKNIYMINF